MGVAVGVVTQTYPHSTVGESLHINGVEFGEQGEELEDAPLHCQTLVVLECLRRERDDDVMILTSSHAADGTWRTIVLRFFLLTDDSREDLKNFSSPMSFLLPVTMETKQLLQIT